MNRIRLAPAIPMLIGLFLLLILSWSVVTLSHAQARLPSSPEDKEATEVTKDAFKRGSWRSLPTPQLRQLVVQSTLSYGLEPRGDRLRELQDMYREFVKRVPLQERAATSTSVAIKVEKGLSSADALMPFLYYDPAFAVVSSSALHMAGLVRTPLPNLLAGPTRVCTVAKGMPSDERRGQILAGLLLLGDQRIMPVVRDCFLALGPSGRKQLSRASSGYAYKAVIDFFLDWLDATVDREDEFGMVAGSLGRLAIQAQPREVLDVERQFPVSGDRGTDAVKITRRWTISEYGLIIAPRLRALAQREREPKVIPLVMDAWGITE